ncbi:MAG: type II secretion system F family protein [Candidatus Limnocylindrales bacterium]
MDLTLLGALATGIAVFAGLMALRPGGGAGEATVGARVAAWRAARVEAVRGELARARLDLRPQAYLAVWVAAPVALGLAGLILSVPMAVLGAAAGAFVPRLYVRYLVAGEARAADDEAPRVLRAMVNRAAAGGTYPDLFAAASEVARHRWVKSDFEELLGRYYANEPLADALAAVRPRQAGRNLALVFDALTVLAVTHQPASAAASVLGALNEAARSNQAIARSAAAESRGLRVQALILAVVIPALFLYLLLANRELVAPVVDTTLGRLVLLPAAALLEVAGVVLSWRATSLEV